MKIFLLPGANTLNQSNKQLVVDLHRMWEINKQKVEGKKEMNGGNIFMWDGYPLPELVTTDMLFFLTYSWL